MQSDRRFPAARRDFYTAEDLVGRLQEKDISTEHIETIAHYMISIARAQRREDRTSTAGPRCSNTTTHYAPPQQPTGEHQTKDHENVHT
ncbi:MAG TPA: hypothetical protein VM182_16990 [Terriglobia bacterium]|nr:hypothetical protein [Terriglobia bacterium]